MPDLTESLPQTQRAADGRKTRAALYIRVSTNHGDQDPDNQALQLRDFCRTKSWMIVREYEDRESGGKRERCQLQAMLRDAAARRFDVLLIWALDRLSREGTLATLRYLEQLEHYGVRWRSFTEPWVDSAGAFREVVISLLATLAKQEQARIRERVMAGVERARLKGTRSGKPIGRPRVVFAREQVVELRSQGLSWSTIASRLGVNTGSVRRVFQAFTEPYGALPRAQSDDPVSHGTSEAQPLDEIGAAASD